MAVVRNNKEIINDDHQLPSKPCEDCTTWIALCFVKPANRQRNEGSDFDKFSASLGYLWQFFDNTSSISACFVPIAIGGIELSIKFEESRNVMFLSCVFLYI